MNIEPKIFRAYDVRGLADEISPEAAEKIARALVMFTGADSVVVGRDMRETSPQLLEAVIRGVTESGADAIDIGLCSTPLFYYAVGAQFAGAPERGAGIMVTASHNPKEYNGLKLERGNVSSVGSGSGMEQVRDLAIKGEFAVRPEGNALEIDVREEYVAKLLEAVAKSEVGKPKLAIDAGNGMGGYVAEDVLKAYGLANGAKKLFFEPDGSFPNHVPNPVDPKNLVAVSEAVRAAKADLGVAYDGDADRVGFTDENGEPVRGDLMTAVIAAEVLADHPGAPILYDLRSSKAVGEAIAAAGGVPIMCRVGHSYIKDQMRETGAYFAGEFSTHYYFRHFHNAESSDLAMLYVLRALRRSGKKMSELVAPLKIYSHSGEINFEVKDKEGLMAKLDAEYGKAGKVSRLDGLRVDLPEWWFSVRASNTEPLVRLNLEAGNEAEMKRKVEEVSEIIKRF